ncbi:MAG: GtrA family protein [Anaerolineales bacterium]|nr:GtrA family protein [Anaerolineales bacterium]
MITLANPAKPKELQRFSRFLAVGALGALIDFNVLTTFKLLGMPTLPANSLSFSAGLFNNYLLNSRWTFSEQANNWKRKLPQFILVSLVGLALNNAIVLPGPLGELVGQVDWGCLPARVVATGVVVFWNYFVNRCWTFRSQAAGDKPPATGCTYLPKEEYV